MALSLPNSSSSSAAWAPPGQRSLHERAVETLRYLSEEIDPRRAGSLGEAQAAGYVAGRLRRAAFAPTILSFRAGMGERWPLLIVAGLGLAGVALALLTTSAGWQALALSLMVIALVLTLAELEGAAPLRRVMRGHSSQSVVAVRAAAGRLRWRVVLLAPLDGPSRSVLHRREVRILLAALIAGLIAVAGELLAAAVLWRLMLMAAGSVLLGVGLLIVARTRHAPPLPAIHGAGDLATLLLAAEELEPLTHVEVWMAALGGGTVGHESIRALLERYPFSSRDTCFINLHAIATGQPAFVTREGVLRERRSDRLLLALANATDAADLQIDAAPRRLEQRTLAQALLAQGQRVITITSQADAAPVISPDPATIERCVRLVVGMIQRLESEKSPAIPIQRT